MNDDERNDGVRPEEELEALAALVRGSAGAMVFPVLAEAHRRAGRPEQAERVAREGLEAAPHVGAGRVALALALLDQKRADEAKRELVRLLGGETEHVLAADAVAAELPEAGPREIGGELATLDPYPFDAYAPGVAAGGDLAGAEPSLVLEPPGAGPFGPPPPAPAEPRVFDGGSVRDEELDTAFEEAESDREQMLGADDVARAALAAVPEDADDAVDAAGEGDGLALAAAPGSPFATETVAGLLERQGHGEAAERIRHGLAHEPADEDDEPVAPAPAGAAPHGAGHEHKATLERWLDNLRRDRR